ncbi:MAG TPA: YcxB family protein, partial [Abditibacteriaceae bacterium]|nr:YcxB family protein [Abditibacteriaceae bacterium]
ALANSEGIMFIFPQEDDFAAWSSMTVTETKNLFAIFRDEQQFAALPKRAFANAADLEQFRAWASGIGQKDAPPSAPIPQP